jgi:hypothetical protein
MGRSTWRHIAEEVYCVLMKLKVDSIFAKAMLGRCTTIHQYNKITKIVKILKACGIMIRLIVAEVMHESPSVL